MFFKENSSRILKTFGFGCIISIFGFMLSMATIDNPVLMYLGAIVMFACYLYLMYDPMWQLGGKDAVSPSAKCYPAKGLLISLVAFAPAFILTLICIIVPPAAITIGEVTDYNFTYVIFQLSRLIFHGVYYGIVQHFLPFAESNGGDISNLSLQPIVFIFTLIPGIAAGSFGYYMGSKEKSLKAILGIKPKAEN